MTASRVWRRLRNSAPAAVVLDPTNDRVVADDKDRERRIRFSRMSCLIPARSAEVSCARSRAPVSKASVDRSRSARFVRGGGGPTVPVMLTLAGRALIHSRKSDESAGQFWGIARQGAVCLRQGRLPVLLGSTTAWGGSQIGGKGGEECIGHGGHI
jgi:hypothetical protein